MAVNKITGTFSSKYVNTVCTVAENLGAPRETLLDFLEITETDILEPFSRFPVLKVLDLFQLAIALTGEKSFGLKLGQSFKPGTFDIVGYGAMCSHKMRDAILLNHKYQALTQQLGETSLTEDDNSATVEWQIKQNYENLAHKLIPVTEAAMVGYAQFGRWLLWNDRAPICELRFRHENPGYIEAYQEIFACEVTFACDKTQLIFDRRILDTPLPQADPAMVEMLRMRLDQRLENLRDSDSAKHQLLCFLQSQPRFQSISIEKAAKAIGCSDRTLRRRLESENTTFIKVLEDFKKETAAYYLTKSTLPIAEIARLVGYENQSAFNHAFKRWYGDTPNHYRSSVG